jgi:hypothetical protein
MTIVVFFPTFAIVGLLLARTKCPRFKGPMFRQQRVRCCPYRRADLEGPLENPANPR